jgi:hypothetical protein
MDAQERFELSSPESKSGILTNWTIGQLKKIKIGGESKIRTWKTKDPQFSKLLYYHYTNSPVETGSEDRNWTYMSGLWDQRVNQYSTSL